MADNMTSVAQDNVGPVFPMATGIAPEVLATAIPLSITRTSLLTTSLLTTSTDGHLTTVPVTRIIPSPSTTAAPTSPPPSPPNHSAIIAGVIGAVFIAIWIIVFLMLFIEPCLKGRRRSRDQVDLLEGGTDHHVEAPGIPNVSEDTTTPFRMTVACEAPSQQIMAHQVPASHLPSHSRSASFENHAARRSMPQTEEIRNHVTDISRRVNLYSLSTEGSETPNPFSDSAVAPESHTTPLPLGSDVPSPQVIDLIAVRVAEILRMQDPGIGEARSNVPPENGGQARFQRVSQLSGSDRSSTAPPTYATDEE